MELVLQNISKQFDHKNILQHIDYHFHNGIYGLLGANGAGKTTLIKCICDLYKLSEGCILYDGVDIHSLDEEYRKILGYLPQDFGFYPDYTAFDFLVYLGCLKGLTSKTAKEKALKLLEEVDLLDHKHKKLKKFSGGMLRRIGIAQALINEPKILILDEPTAGLDPKERIRLRNIISKFSSNHIVIISTHIVSDIEFIANTILIQKDGRIICSGSREMLLSTINNCVWEGMISLDEITYYTENECVSNLKTEGNQCSIRLVTHTPLDKNFIHVTPCLDDLYLSLFEEETYEATLNH